MKKRTIFETCEGHKAGPDDVDGMEEMLDDDTLDTDWDIAIENPVRAGYSGHLPHPDKSSGERWPGDTGEEPVNDTELASRLFILKKLPGGKK
jgi:hypothetical protein